MDNNKENNKKFFNRYTVLIIVAFAIFAILIVRLIVIQIINNQYYLGQSNNDSIKEISQLAPRGDIVDRNDQILATDVQSYVITFVQTTESKEAFFDTMTKVFNILDSKKENLKDDFYLKVPYAFAFDSDDEKVKKARKLRFMKDRGIEQYIIKQLGIKGKSYKDLSSKQQKKVDEELLNFSAQDTFNYLWKEYTDWYSNNKNIRQETKDKINNYSDQDKRRFMLVFDAIKMQSFSGYKPVTIAENLSRDTAFTLEEKLNELPGIDITQQPQRTYPNGQLASSVLGYISKINSDNQEKYEEKGYDVSTDLIGVAGIEGALEERLKGTKGKKVVEVDKNGRVVKERAQMEPASGQKVQLTISKDLQGVAEKSLLYNLDKVRSNPEASSGANTANATRGAVVVFGVKTGEILALVSEPGFDPNDFAQSGKLTPELLKKYYDQDYEQLGREYIRNRNLLSNEKNKNKTEDQLLDEMFPIDTSIKSDKPVRKDQYDIFPKPLFNYALSSLIPPGSSFKPLTAVAGLESQVITPSFTYFDNKQYDVGLSEPIKFPNDDANGNVDLRAAIAKSSNPYFMEVGRRIREAYGDDKLAEYAWKYGLGVKPNSNTVPATGIELPESFGQVYNTWSNKNAFARNYSIEVMRILKSGKAEDFNNVTFTPIDLYSYSNDSKEVKKIKEDIVSALKDSITSTSTFNGNKFKDLLKKLVDADDSYKGKTFKSADFDLMVKEIRFQTKDTANYQIYKTPINIYNASIGQGTDSFTPLQLADYVATLVNGGNRYKAHLVQKIYDSEGNVVENVKPEVLNTTGVSQSTVDAVKVGMESVTTEGTAQEAFQGFTMKTGGKTGSATYKEKGEQEKVGRTSYSFFVGFAPFDDPEIAVCAVMFDGGYGASVAPVVRNVYEAYFKDKLKAEGYSPNEDFMKDFYNK